MSAPDCMLKRFLLFVGEDYYAAGGWYDFRGSYSTYAEAQLAVPNSRQWCHIVDLEKGVIVGEDDAR